MAALDVRANTFQIEAELMRQSWWRISSASMHFAPKLRSLGNCNNQLLVVRGDFWERCLLRVAAVFV